MKIKEAGEFGLINIISNNLIPSPQSVIKGIGDDTAVLKADTRKALLFTTDMMVEGVHFTLDFSTPKQIGLKALAVNISDIAAMGGIPTNAVVSIGVSGDTEMEIVEGIYEGLRENCNKYRVNIVGGDTVSSRDLTINVALLGEVEKDLVLYRSGASVGDYIYVTGTLGDSAAGLYLLTEAKKELQQSQANSKSHSIIEKHLAPKPRLKEARLLTETRFITSMNDISDGLASELHEIASQSQVGFRIYEDKIPISEAINSLNISSSQAIDWALYGGEDFELVFTVKPEEKERLEKLLIEKELEAQLIGEIISANEGYKMVNRQGQVVNLEAKGFNHFRSE